MDDLKIHARYFQSILHTLPSSQQRADPNRMTLAHFCISALAMLDQLNDDDAKRRCVAWVYGLQIKKGKGGSVGGFRGAPNAGSSFGEHPTAPHPYDFGHIAMTYSALVLLRLCGDDLAGVERRGCVELVRAVQNQDGGFRCHPGDCESDMRFLFCAAAVCSMINDWSGMDVEKAVEYAKRCQNYDGGLGMSPDQESHGGAAYCCVSALKLMKRLDALDDPQRLVRWCLMRQVGGFQGRPTKDPDTCYSFWVAGALQVLEASHLIDAESTFAFTQSCLGRIGFSKCPGVDPDPLHSHFAIAGLSLLHHPAVKPMHAALGLVGGEKYEDGGGESVSSYVS